MSLVSGPGGPNLKTKASKTDLGSLQQPQKYFRIHFIVLYVSWTAFDLGSLFISVSCAQKHKLRIVNTTHLFTRYNCSHNALHIFLKGGSVHFLLITY